MGSDSTSVWSVSEKWKLRGEYRCVLTIAVIGKIPDESSGGLVALNGALRSLGGVQIELRARSTSQAKRFNSGTGVTGGKLLAIDGLLLRLNNQVEGLGLDLLGGDSAKEEKGSQSSD